MNGSGRKTKDTPASRAQWKTNLKTIAHSLNRGLCCLKGYIASKESFILFIPYYTNPRI